MDWLKRLQQKYRDGKLTKEQYDAKVAELLADGDLTQDEHDKALEFDPKAPEGGELIYSEEDMQRMAHNVARRTLRQALKKVGVELDVDNKGLLDKVAELVKVGVDGGGKGNDGKGDPEEVTKLKAKVQTLEGRVKDLGLQNSVLTAAKTFNPVNSVQVVRALSDYEDLIEYDDNGVPERRSVESALRKLVKAEPNLFTPAAGDDDLDNPDDGQQQTGGSKFSGKPPGGGAGASSNAQKSKEDALVAENLARLGIKTDGQK